MVGTVTPDPPTAATVYQSLFPKRNLWGVRVTRWLAYFPAQSGAVGYMAVTY